MIQVVSHIAGLRQMKRYDEAGLAIKSALNEIWDTHLQDLIAMDQEELEELCVVDHTFHVEFAHALSDLLEQQGAIYLYQNQLDASLACHHQALALAQKVVDRGDSIPFDAYERIEHLKERVADIEHRLSS